MDEIPIVENIWMLATGTGIGPYLSILKTESSWKRFEKAILVHAVRFEKELTYQETIKELKEKYKDRFIYITFVSRENSKNSLPGRIPDSIKKGTLQEKAGNQNVARKHTRDALWESRYVKRYNYRTKKNRS